MRPLFENVIDPQISADIVAQKNADFSAKISVIKSADICGILSYYNKLHFLTLPSKTLFFRLKFPRPPPYRVR
jgi:hypothetical protein